MPPLARRDFLKLAALLTLSACTPSPPSPPPPAPTTASPRTPPPTASRAAPPLTPGPASSQEPPTAAPAPPVADVGVLLAQRLAFGPRPLDPDPAFYGDPADESRLPSYVAAQLQPESLDDGDCQARLAAAGFETLDKSLEELAYDHIVNNPYPDDDDRHWEWYILPVTELRQAAHLRAVYSRRQLQELLVDFWHNHFNILGEGDDVAPLFASFDRDVIRTHLFGNFRQFLEAVATHPSMLYYLDNRSSSDAGPNENYARELFELHTLGAENYLGVVDPNQVQRDADGHVAGYVDNDVYEAARAFTGWRVNDDLEDEEDGVDASGTFLYYRPWHDRFNKLVLGAYLPADEADMQDGRAVLDLLAAHPGTARHLAGKLCRRFVSDDPPESLVAAVAATFYAQRDAPDQLRQVYTTLFLAPELRQAALTKVKRPFEVTIGALRGLGAEFTRLPAGLRWTSEMMGQPLFGRASPDGYPDRAAAWANTMTSLYAWNLVTGLGENWWSEEQDGPSVVVDLAGQTPQELRSATEIVAVWLERLRLPLAPEGRAALTAFLAAEADPDAPLPDDERAARLAATIELMLMTPEFRSR